MNQFEHTPEGRELVFIDPENEFLRVAKKYALTHSKDPKHPTGAVIVKENNIIGIGANGSDYHKNHGCPRKKKGIKSGEGYELCEGCHPKNHAEQRAISSATEDTIGADLYLWGHWYCCRWCWAAMSTAGIKNVFLAKTKLDKSEEINRVK